MLRRLAHLALTVTVLATAASPALARGFAAPPPASAPMPISISIEDRSEPDDSVAYAPVLSDAVRARLRTVLAARRDRNLRAFASYVRRGRYPHNFQTNGSLNVWRDREGHLCAAATMINQAGARKLVARVARTDNFIRLADVTDGPLLDWILTSGLTHAEIVAIQEPFMGEPELPQRDWRTVEDARLRARYAEVSGQLAAGRPASLDAAIDALTLRPDLVAQLIGG